jgi:hypothetical protein
MLRISVTYSTTFVLAHPTFMSKGTTIVCASSFGASTRSYLLLLQVWVVCFVLESNMQSLDKPTCML